MISDFVKGKEQFGYPDEVRKGILIHREIDRFTDVHPVNREARKIFSYTYGLYSGVFLDIAYDHFVATDTRLFQQTALKDFSSRTYRILEEYSGQLPLRFRNILPYMKKQNWLYNYQFEWGIANSFRGIIQRASFISDKDSAIKLFKDNYELLREHYDSFFPDLIEHTLSIFGRQGILIHPEF